MFKSSTPIASMDSVHVVDIEDDRLGELDNSSKRHVAPINHNYIIRPDDSSLNFLHKKDPYYNIPGLKNEIHHTVWRCLSREGQAGIIKSIQTVRPEKVSKALWEALSDIQKTDINHSISRGEENTGMKKVVERPDEIAPNIWELLEIETQNEIYDKLDLIRPKGFDEELWERLDGNCHETVNKAMKEHILNSKSGKNSVPQTAKVKSLIFTSNYWIKKIRKSRIVNFFISPSHIMDDPDAGIGALSLVCALILTIPYGILQFLNGDFFHGLQVKMQSCPGGRSLSDQDYHQVFQRMITSLATSIFGSMMGLILSSFYYIFQPLAGRDIESWCRRQGKYLIGAIFTCTLVAVIGLLDLTRYILNFYAVRLEEVCTYDIASTYYIGLAFIALSFVIGVACLW